MDKKIEDALQNEDIQNIMNKAAGSFRSQLAMMRFIPVNSMPYGRRF